MVSNLRRIRIPVYVIACGVQVDSYAHLDELIGVIGKPAKHFISAVYDTGGEFALRGEVTKEFFTRLGYPSAVVTGCPSLYQLGRELRVRRAGGAEKPVFNGSLAAFRALMRELPESVYVSQGEYFSELFNPAHAIGGGFPADVRFVKNQGAALAGLLGEDRVQYFADMSAWYAYLRREGFGFSVGGRLHGNVMAILSGVPALILSVDERTREVADFFCIPTQPFKPGHSYTKRELLTLWEAADYTRFEREFPGRFDFFERFLAERGIVRHVNRDNPFLRDEEAEEAYRPNREAFARYSAHLKRNGLLLSTAAKAAALRRKRGD